MNNKQLFSTDEQLVELGNHLIKSDNEYTKTLEYNGNTYKIIMKKESTRYNEISKKSLTISKDDKELVIYATEDEIMVDDPNKTTYDHWAGWIPIRVPMRRYFLSYIFKNNSNSRLCLIHYPIYDFKRDFTLDDFESNNSLCYSSNKGNDTKSCKFDKSLSTINEYYSSNNKQYGTFTINDNNLEYNISYSYGGTRILFSLDGKKIIDYDTLIKLDIPKEFILANFSTLDDVEKYNPDEIADDIFKLIKKEYPSYAMNEFNKIIKSFFKNLKKKSSHFATDYLTAAEGVIELHNEFKKELTYDENGRNLYFDKDELNNIIKRLNSSKEKEMSLSLNRRG